MTVSKNKIFADEMRGATVLEVLLAMAIIAMATPFVYRQIAQSNHTIHDIAAANKIVSLRDSVLNFVRINQDKWPDTAQIKLSEEELRAISDAPVAGFIDKYQVKGATVTDVYLAFESQESKLRTTKIAQYIGGDAAVIGDDGVAYGSTWAVAAPDFIPGDLIYRISRDIAGVDTSKYLHRASSGEDSLNMMERDLNMGGYNVYNVANTVADSASAQNATTMFLNTPDLSATNIYFSSGANVNGEDVFIDSLRVSGDTSGFRTIYADNLNGRNYTTTGRIIADKASILGTVNVAKDMVVKSDYARTISGFTGINTNSVLTPFITTEEMIIYNNFGLTVSGELLMSTTVPIKFGNWSFPSTKPPQFSEFTVSRATLPTVPNASEFDDIIKSGWQYTGTIPTIQ